MNMACSQTNYVATSTSSRGYIYDTLLKIDQLQKAASVESACEGCDGSLAAAFYNTKPIEIYLNGGTKLAFDVPNTATTTTYFRIESVKTDAVVLRLITSTNGTMECTNYTAIASIGCICGLQCFQPICCPKCPHCTDS